MAVKQSPQPWLQFEDSNGDPYTGALLFCYAAGSTTKLDTFTDNTGNTANTNPIVLDARGVTPNPVWLTEGLNYKYVLAPSTDTDPPTSAIKTYDNITAINDVNVTVDQWAASGATPTFTGATTFTVPGDLTSDFQVGRRVKCTVSAGTAYGTISVSAYTSLTTVTVENDSTALDAGLSAVSYGILTPTNPSIPDYTLFDDSVATANIQDNAVTLAKMAGITAGKLISGDSSGDPQYETYLQWVTNANSGQLTSGTTQAFTGIPASATRIEITCKEMQTATSNAALYLQVGYGATPTYLSASGDYPGDLCYVSDTAGGTGDLKTAWDTFATVQPLVQTANNRNQTRIVLTKTNDGSNDTWDIFSAGNYVDSSGLAWVVNSGGGVKGASLSTALTAVKFTLSAGTFADGYITLKYYGNAEV